MTTYRVYTRTINENVYDLDLTLPVEMGEAGPRLTDRLIRTAAASGSLDLLDAQIIGAVDEGPEEIYEITRDDKVIWPAKHRKKAPKAMTVSPAPAHNTIAFPDPNPIDEA